MKGHNWGLCKKCNKFHKHNENPEKSRKTQIGRRYSIETEFKKGETPWNKGKTKDNDEKIKIYSKKYENLHRNTFINYNKTASHEKRVKQSLKGVQTRKKNGHYVSSRKNNTSIEKCLRDELKNKGYFPISQYPYEITIIDFAFPNKKLAIYCDGDYWHANPKKYDINSLNEIQKHNLGYDKRNNNFLSENGWKILRFWEYDIKNNLESCVNKIMEEMK